MGTSCSSLTLGLGLPETWTGWGLRGGGTQGPEHSCGGGDGGVIRDSRAEIIQTAGAPGKHIT